VNKDKPEKHDLPLELEWLPGRYAVCRLDAAAPLPAWAAPAAMPTQAGAKRSAAPGQPSIQSTQTVLSITRTDRELSIMIDEQSVPEGVQAQRGFVALRVKGVLDFSCVGILAKLTGALATANIPVFVISTFETDLILIREAEVQTATRVLVHNYIRLTPQPHAAPAALPRSAPR
jgi:hypothetical protein